MAAIWGANGHLLHRVPQSGVQIFQRYLCPHITRIEPQFFNQPRQSAPVFISPLFNEYKPMREGPLKEDILSLARANGIPADEVYEVDESRQSTRISANVQGIFGTTRISLNDDLLKLQGDLGCTIVFVTHSVYESAYLKFM